MYDSCVFEGARVELGGAPYHHCTFRQCLMVIDGRPVELDGCTFDNCSWTFEGAAGNSIAMLKTSVRTIPVWRQVSPPTSGSLLAALPSIDRNGPARRHGGPAPPPATSHPARSPPAPPFGPAAGSARHLTTAQRAAAAARLPFWPLRVHFQNMLDRRTYRHPSTGEEAHLTVDRVTGPGGARWWSVSLVRADGDRGALDGYPAIEWCRHGIRLARATGRACGRCARREAAGGVMAGLDSPRNLSP